MNSPSDSTMKLLVVLLILGMVVYQYQFEIAEFINSGNSATVVPSNQYTPAAPESEVYGVNPQVPGWGIRKFQYHPQSHAFTFEVFTDFTGSVHYQNKYSLESIPRRNVPLNPEVINYKPSDFTVRIGPDGIVNPVLHLEGKHLTPGLYRVSTNYMSNNRLYHWVITYRWTSSNQIVDIEKQLHVGHRVQWD